MKVSQRLVSLDVFRGLTIILMIIVNTPGTWAHVFSPLRHSEWHGCTPTDLVFPFFLFIVGVAMWFSFKKFDHKFTKYALLKILKRTALIFLIGLFMNAFPKFDIAHLRIMGVLQRIALAYGLGAFLILLFGSRGRWVLAFAVLFGYWIIMWVFGGDNPYGLENNFARKIDLAVFGINHVHKGFGIPFEPEGLLSTLPAMVNVLLGFLAGEIIGKTEIKKNIPLKLLVYGGVSVLLAILWNTIFPINKPLWTSSYVLCSVGIGMISLAILIWIIDIKEWRKWAHPFLVYGMNPLALYVLSILWVKVILYLVYFRSDGETLNGYAWLYQKVFIPIGGPGEFGSFLFALFHGVLFWLIGYILYRKKIFIKI